MSDYIALHFRQPETPYSAAKPKTITRKEHIHVFIYPYPQTARNRWQPIRPHRPRANAAFPRRLPLRLGQRARRGAPRHAVGAMARAASLRGSRRHCDQPSRQHRANRRLNPQRQRLRPRHRYHQHHAQRRHSAHQQQRTSRLPTRFNAQQTGIAAQTARARTAQRDWLVVHRCVYCGRRVQ